MKYLKITSMVVFELKKKVADILAKELFNLDKNLGSRFQPKDFIKNTVKSEQYLNYQFQRLCRYAATGEFSKFDFLARILLKKSKTYLIYALNHVYPNWTSMTFTKVIAILKKVMKYTASENNTLHYKRVWIDKKVDDYGRPLGVPYGEDRIEGHMYTRIIEAYLHGTNQIPANQQGGISKRGIMTFLKIFVDKFKRDERIFEFDIKGYFDHISHDAVLELTENSKVITHYLKGALKSSPITYNLPPVDKDKAVIEYQKIQDNAGDDFYIEDTTHIINSMVSQMPYEERLEYEMNRMSRPSNFSIEESGLSMREIMDLCSFLEGKPLKDPDPLDLFRSVEKDYKNLMEDKGFVPDPLALFNNVNIVKQDFDEDERAKGRDSWKDLDLPNQGVPQGSSFGPIIASVLLGKLMPPEALLYMDDGLIFLGKSKVTVDDMINNVNRILKPIMCELSPEKCSILTTNNLLKTGVKIIGMRIKRAFSTGISITSETRKGIKKPFFEFNKDNVTAMLREMYDRDLLTVSKYKILSWYTEKGKLDVMYKGPLVELAERLKILGTIINRAFSPAVDLEEMKREIQEGISRATLKLYRAKGSLGERIVSNGIYECETLTPKEELPPGELTRVATSVFNCRSVANDILLRYLKGELPVRSLRVQGMRKPFNRDSRTTGTSSKGTTNNRDLPTRRRNPPVSKC